MKTIETHNFIYEIDEVNQRIVAILKPQIVFSANEDVVMIQRIFDKNTKLGNIKPTNIMSSLDFYDPRIPNKVFRGVAKCAPEDEYDEEVGMTIARNKALVKYYAAKEKSLEEVIKNIGSVYIDLCDELRKTTERKNKAYSEEL